MSSEVAAAFNELFYGSGAWLGILILELIIISGSLKSKWASVLFLPITVFMGIDYLDNVTVNTNQVWLAVIMFFTAIFLVFNLVHGDKK